MRIVTLALLALTGCAPASDDRGPAAKPEAAPSSSRTVEARFRGWSGGDFEWVDVEFVGKVDTVGIVADHPIDKFLTAYRDHIFLLELRPIRMRGIESDHEWDALEIIDAQVGNLTASAWWGGLNTAEKKAAEERTELEKSRATTD